MKKILVAGGTGLVGAALVQKLLAEGYDVAVLTRNPTNGGAVPSFKWNIKERYVDPAAWQDVWGVINLAGAGIVDKAWTNARKSVLKESRVDGNQLLIDQIGTLEKAPAVYLSASAIGFYGDRPDETVDEGSPAGPDSFLVRLCQEWESSTERLIGMRTRRLIIRIGLVLSGDGGVVPRLRQTMPLGIGSYFGDGSQGTSWIHIDDLTRLMIYLMEQEDQGVYNAVAPTPVTFKELVRQLVSDKGGLRVLLPVPPFVLKLVMGERSTAILQDVTVIPRRLLDSGFSFVYEELLPAIKSLS
ncbi:MAG: TIGR01777 family oxidoreductase [Saprospiraceae bacterium]|nr:TIGR01777 family oxidoreductase [Saprospiraceae bacterium]